LQFVSGDKATIEQVNTEENEMCEKSTAMPRRPQPQLQE